MCAEVQTISDKVFIEQFENLTLDEVYFNHEGHLRAAWLYLNRYDLDQAIDVFSLRIKAYAENLGAKDKFHVTITNSMMRIIAQRFKHSDALSWQLFLDENPDLRENAMELLCQHYSKQRLMSEQARTSLLMPDLQTIGV